MNSRTKLGMVLATTVIAVLAVGHIASEGTAQATKAAGDTPLGTTQSCREVAAELQIMGSELYAIDDSLSRTAQAMHQASDAERIEAVIATIDQLIQQRRATISYLKTTHQKMIVHLFEHSATGGAEALGACPIMKQMNYEEHRGGAGEPTGSLDR